MRNNDMSFKTKENQPIVDFFTFSKPLKGFMATDSFVVTNTHGA